MALNTKNKKVTFTSKMKGKPMLRTECRGDVIGLGRVCLKRQAAVGSVRKKPYRNQHRVHQRVRFLGKKGMNCLLKIKLC